MVLDQLYGSRNMPGDLPKQHSSSRGLRLPLAILAGDRVAADFVVRALNQRKVRVYRSRSTTQR